MSGPFISNPFEDPYGGGAAPAGPATWEILTVGIANLGFGYALNDEMDLDIAAPNDTPITPARVRVTNESGGSIQAVTVINPGEYNFNPLGQSCDFINVIGSGLTANGTVDSTQVKP
jgi:hypothetical protein